MSITDNYRAVLAKMTPEALLNEAVAQHEKYESIDAEREKMRSLYKEAANVVVQRNAKIEELSKRFEHEAALVATVDALKEIVLKGVMGWSSARDKLCDIADRLTLPQVKEESSNE